MAYSSLCVADRAPRRAGGAGRAPRSALVVLAFAALSLVALTVAPPPLGGQEDPGEVAPEPPARADDAPAPLVALGAERGLARAEAERKALVVIVLPAAIAETYRTELVKSLRASTRERLAESFVVVEVVLIEGGAWPPSEPVGPAEKPQPWTSERSRGFLEGRLGRLGEPPTLALLDFAGTLLARFDGEPPAESRLKKALRGAAAANEKRAKSFAEAEKLLEQLGLALKRKQYTEACRSLIALRAIDLPSDSKPALARQERFAELEEAYAARVATAKKLEDEDHLAEAVAELDRILQEFPLPEWQDELRRRIGILWRKIYGRGPG